MSQNDSSKPTLRAALSPQALKRMEALKSAGSMTEQDKKERNEQRAKRAKFKRTLEWLDETFPKCFNQKSPLPLKIKIEADLFQALKDNEAYGAEFSNLNIRKALSFYTSRLAYQESILTHTHRVDLDGNDAGALDDTHKAHAEQRIQEIKDKIGD